MSIRNLLVSVISVLALMLFAVSIFITQKAFKNRNIYIHAAKISKSVSDTDLLAAVGDWAVE